MQNDEAIAILRRMKQDRDNKLNVKHSPYVRPDHRAAILREMAALDVAIATMILDPLAPRD